MKDPYTLDFIVSLFGAVIIPFSMSWVVVKLTQHGWRKLT